jgi:hypothetical protein
MVAEDVQARSLTVRVPVALHAVLEQRAAAQADTVSAVVRAMLREGLATSVGSAERLKDFSNRGF